MKKKRITALLLALFMVTNEQPIHLAQKTLL